MKKQQLIVSLVALFLTGSVHAQNVGIGTPTPTGKLHIEQPAGVDGILVNHSGAAGNSVEVIASNVANNNIVFWVRNASSGASAVAQNTNTTSTASNIISFNDGLGRGIDLAQTNTGANEAAIFASQAGTGPFSRGLDLSMLNGSTGIGATIFQAGTGRALYADVSNATSTAATAEFYNQGTGNGLWTEITNASSGGIGGVFFQNGTGRGSATQIANNTSTAIANGIYHAGNGIGQEVELLNTTSTAGAQLLINRGLGRGNEVSLTNAANADVGSAVFHSGDGIGQYVTISNTAATRNSTGLLLIYNATGTTGGGGGNALEVQHNGTNGNAAEIFVGTPTIAAGPANTTSEYAGLTINQMATGTSPTAGANKSALQATNHSADPTILVNNSGPNNGEGINVFTNPTTAAGALSAATYSQAQVGTNGFGVGVWAQGGNYGVVGSTGASGANVGIFSNSDFQAVGTKTFVIDHPLDPANKKLRHFCIESNEVLNLYRGMVTLDANGQAIVELPSYFDAINKNVSYQLTAIGTAVQPYIKEEVANNQFVVAGAPNTKVSWTLYAERNDPTIQYFEQVVGKDYRNPETMKPASERGKYLTPQAYGQDESQAIFYNPAHKQLEEEAKAGSKHQQASEAPQQTPKKSSGGIEPQRGERPQPSPAKPMDLTKQ